MLRIRMPEPHVTGSRRALLPLFFKSFVDLFGFIALPVSMPLGTLSHHYGCKCLAFLRSSVRAMRIPTNI